MKTSIRGTFGYLSQQPDGSIQSRPTGDGPWEQFEVEGSAPPTPGPTPPQPTPDPNWPTPSQTAAYVAAVKAKLEDMGENLSGPCGAFKITARVAWGLRGAGAGYLSKPAGNNCDGNAVDIIAYATGVYVDILGDAGNANVPAWNEAGDTIDPARWRPPVLP